MAILLSRRQTLLWRAIAVIFVIVCFILLIGSAHHSSIIETTESRFEKSKIEKPCHPVTADEAKLRFLETNFRDTKRNMMEAQKKMESVLESVKPSNNHDNAIRKVNIKTFPNTHVYCYGKDRDSRICRFRGICFDPNKDGFVAFKGPSSVLEGNHPVNQKERSEKLYLDITSLKDHNAFYWDYSEIDPKSMKPQEVEWIEKKTFLFHRFLFVNIMHTFHDDILNLFDTLMEFADAPISDPFLYKQNDNFTLNTLEPFGKDHNIMFIDHFRSGETTPLFSKVTDNPLLYKADMREKKIMTCFSDAIIGISKRNTWYHYGFGSPQGPILNKKTDGLRVRKVSEYYLRQYGITPLSIKELESSIIGSRCIVIFSRTRDRLIVNEKDLKQSLEDYFGIPAFYVRMEDTSFEEQIRLLSRAYIAIGMHGSLLIMGIFLPPGAILIELYPFAVPSENYTPYKTMSSLVGMNIAYAAWENKHEKNNIMHPTRSADRGGIAHLPQSEQDKIIATHTVPSHTCCSDPYWLFRIYQDTIVDTNEVIKLISSVEKESKDNILRYKRLITTPRKDISVAVIDKVECSIESKNKILITWNQPWNTEKSSIDHYGVWIHQPYREYDAKENKLIFECESSAVYDIYVRTYPKSGGELDVSRWTPKIECKCP